jgi:alginate O-acetyltransferase complex protein AlgI
MATLVGDILRIAITNDTVVVVLVVLLMWVVAWNLRSVRARQALLLLAGYYFYSSWGMGFLVILIASSLLNFALGAILRRQMTAPYLWFGISINILLLGFFKYLPAILKIGGPGSWQDGLAQSIIMPIGMSFWTFQGLSYLVDIYLEEEINPSLLEFCLYMAFWPTVISGPVCRLPNMLLQFREKPVFSWSDISIGALLLCQGFFMKLFLAQLGVAAGFDQVKSGWGGIDVWLLGIGFGFLLFFDFAGYSLMVIGVSRLFGVQLASNFDRPFLSTTPTSFWNRWHMSLSFWIRDYLFRPMAAARRGHWWSYVAVFISMTLFGLWHGAKWTFVLFGCYHGLLLIGHRLGQRSTRRFPILIPARLGSFLSWGITFLLVSLGFVFFRANDLTEAFSMFRSVFSPSAYLRFVMPHNFYIFTVFIPLGYFAFTAGGLLLDSWRTRYRNAMSGSAQPTVSLSRVSIRSLPVIVGALFDFLMVRLWWWFAPTVVILSTFVGLAAYTQRVAINVTPFIYTLF